MGTLVSYEVQAGVASMTMDDGRVNVLSPAMFAELNEALDRAEADGAVVLLAGREDRFAAGFDLGVLRGGGQEAADLVRAGWELSDRLLSFPTPVVIACTGHAYAMGAFTLLSGDYRLGAAGAPHRITANEVAIGMVLPESALVICRQRIPVSHVERVVNLAEVFTPDAAVAAGFLDEVVPPGELLAAAHRKAEELTTLDMAAHAATKQRARASTLQALRTAVEHEHAAARARAGA